MMDNSTGEDCQGVFLDSDRLQRKIEKAKPMKVETFTPSCSPENTLCCSSTAVLRASLRRATQGVYASWKEGQRCIFKQPPTTKAIGMFSHIIMNRTFFFIAILDVHSQTITMSFYHIRVYRIHIMPNSYRTICSNKFGTTPLVKITTQNVL